MKYCRFQLNEQAQYGLVEPVAGRDMILRILLTPPEESDGDVEGLRTRRIEPIALDEAVLLPPVRPSKIVCVGRNYRAHAEETGATPPSVPATFFDEASSEVNLRSPVRPSPCPVRLDGSGSPWASPLCCRTLRYLALAGVRDRIGHYPEP